MYSQCVLIPLGSPTVVQKQLYTLPRRRVGGGCTWWGMGTGWVRGGVYRVPSQLPGEGPTDSGAGPGSPAGWSGWSVGAGRTTHGQMKLNMGTGDGGGDGPSTTLRARSVPLGPPCTGTLQIAASWPIRRDLTSFFYKVSQNGEVSSEKCEKACHSPHIQNGSRKSPLEIPGFPFWPAFSHKELMVPI